MVKLQRILFRFTKNAHSRAEVLDLMLTEKLLQTLPLSVAAHVRDKNPKSAKEAAKLADFFFQDRRSTPDHPRWQRRPFQPRGQGAEDFLEKEKSGEQQHISKPVDAQQMPTPQTSCQTWKTTYRHEANQHTVTGAAEESGRDQLARNIRICSDICRSRTEHGS